MTEIASGLFVLVLTILRYVSDTCREEPMESLVEILRFMDNLSQLGAKNPLETLDLLYSQILADVPEDTFPKMRQILYFSAGLSPSLGFTTQGLCNFLDMDQHGSVSPDMPLLSKRQMLRLSPKSRSLGQALYQPARGQP